jgi:excisionase family DNA binding protein
MLTIDDLRKCVTVPLWPEAGQLLGIGKNSTYAAAKSGEIPVLKIGGRYLCSAPALLRLIEADVTTAR